MFSSWLLAMGEAAATVAAQATESDALVALPLVSKGILTVVIGLLGVFLVLGIIFAAIKLMQRIKAEEKDG